MIWEETNASINKRDHSITQYISFIKLLMQTAAVATGHGSVNIILHNSFYSQQPNEKLLYPEA